MNIVDVRVIRRESCPRLITEVTVAISSSLRLQLQLQQVAGQVQPTVAGLQLGLGVFDALGLG